MVHRSDGMLQHPGIKLNLLHIFMKAISHETHHCYKLNTCNSSFHSLLQIRLTALEDIQAPKAAILMHEAFCGYGNKMVTSK